MNEIICGDSLQVIQEIDRPIRMVFADPPDNSGQLYNGYRDKRSRFEYMDWLAAILCTMSRATVEWLSFDHQWITTVSRQIDEWEEFRRYGAYRYDWFIWRYTFGQHNSHDCGSGFRPILRISEKSVKWNVEAIRVESQRQRNGDKRADPRGRVPDNVWEFPRIVGNAKEKRDWCPNQHPEALIERMVRMSAMPGRDLVVDMFAGTGTVNRVCKRLGVDCIGIEIDPESCERIREDLGIVAMIKE